MRKDKKFQRIRTRYIAAEEDSDEFEFFSAIAKRKADIGVALFTMIENKNQISRHSEE